MPPTPTPTPAPGDGGGRAQRRGSASGGAGPGRVQRRGSATGSTGPGRVQRRGSATGSSATPTFARPNRARSGPRGGLSRGLPRAMSGDGTATGTLPVGSATPRRGMNRSKSMNESRFARVATASSSNTTTALMDNSSNRSLGDGADLLGGMAMSNKPHSQSSVEDNSATATSTASRNPRQFQNSTKAFARFMDDSSEDNFNSRPGSAANSASAPSDFHMSQLKFPTVTSTTDSSSTAPAPDAAPTAGISIFDEDNDILAQEHPASAGISRYNKSIRTKKAPPSAANQGRDASNVFASRQDLREVDQSVNLMDVDAGKYESQSSNRRGKNKRQSMVEVFLGDQAADLPFKAPLSKPKNGRRNYNNYKLYRTNGDTFVDQVTNSVGLFFKIVCSLPVLIFLAILGSGLILIPMLLDHLETQPQQQVKTPAPKPLPTTTTTTTSTTDNGDGDALFTSTQVHARLQALQDILSEEGLDTAMANPQAMQWIAAHDPAKMDITNSAPVLERLAVAAFYFAMHPETTAETVGMTIAAATAATTAERQANRRQLSSSSWMSDSSVCQWRGLECENKLVVHFNASHSNLQGELPQELVFLTELVDLDVSHNKISGELPATYPTYLSRLEYALFQDNDIGGSLPASIGEWTSLYHLDIAENRLTGSLPASLGKLTQTRLLFLHSNQLEGSIPLQMGHLPKLEYLWLGSNQLTGELHMDLLSKLSSIVDLRLGSNSLTGTIPPELESLHRLTSLQLDGNQLVGSLPNIFDRMHNLVDLQLQKNSLTGTLPDTLGSVKTLERLLLDHNQFKGSIPESWRGLESLQTLRLDHTNLTGDMSLCSSLPQLSLMSADCLSKITCDCCKQCY